METKQKQNTELLNNPIYADREAVCEAVISYSRRNNYENITEQITEKLMEITTPEAWKVYTKTERESIIEVTAKGIRMAEQ